jgi:glycosyltransferase involved in cell wall biosynthesis
MKILNINNSDMIGGASIAAYRLHRSLKSAGLESKMLVQKRVGNDSSVIGRKTEMRRGVGYIRPTLDKLLLKYYPKRRNVLFHPGWLPLPGMLKRVNEIGPDIVHLHWVCEGFVPIEGLKGIQRPIIWTLHDMWPFSGGCHYDENCGRYILSCGNCPILRSGKTKDMSRWIWERKKKAWRKLKLTIVSPSRWLANCAKKSSLFRRRRIEVIPNGIDINLYKPIEKKICRKIWRLPQNKRLVLFGAMSSTSDKRKGYFLLRDALQKYVQKKSDEETEVVIFGQNARKTTHEFGLKIHYLGRLHDDVSIALLYSSADIFVAPSIQENLSNMVIEALACGTPCVAFKIGGMSDMIDHKKNGYLAQPDNSEDLTHGIAWAIGDEERRRKLSLLARKKAEEEFCIDMVAERYKRLYREITKQSY